MLSTDSMTRDAVIAHRRALPVQPVAACRRSWSGPIAHALAARRCKGVKSAWRGSLLMMLVGAILCPSSPQPARRAGRASYLVMGVGHRRHGPTRCRRTLTKSAALGRLAPTSLSHPCRRCAANPLPMSSMGDRPAPGTRRAAAHRAAAHRAAAHRADDGSRASAPAHVPTPRAAAPRGAYSAALRSAGLSASRSFAE